MTKSERVVLVDMDGVMADFDTAAVKSIPEDLRVDRSHFYVAQDYEEALRPSIEVAYNAPGFFENLEPMPGLLEAWQIMIDNGYQPQVASAPLSSNPTAIEGKIKWLDRIMVPEFGAQVVERAIIDKNKWQYGGLALIDDRPSVPRGIGDSNMAEWEHVLFGWQHHLNVPMATAAFRLLSWNDTKDLISILDTIDGSILKSY